MDAKLTIRRRFKKNSKTSSKNNKYKDTALNHSKMVRKMEKRLKTLMLDFNTGVIIRMNLTKKIELIEKLDQIILFRK